MTSDDIAELNDLADAVAAAFEEYRQSDEFKAISIVVETSNRDRPALIVHVERDNATDLADEVEAFLTDRGVRTKRESTAHACVCSRPSSNTPTPDFLPAYELEVEAGRRSRHRSDAVPPQSAPSDTDTRPARRRSRRPRRPSRPRRPCRTVREVGRNPDHPGPGYRRELCHLFRSVGSRCMLTGNRTLTCGYLMENQLRRGVSIGLNRWKQTGHSMTRRSSVSGLNRWLRLM